MYNLVDGLTLASKIEKLLIESGGEITPEIESLLKYPMTAELVDSSVNSIERLNHSSDFFKMKAAQMSKISKALEESAQKVLDETKRFMVESGKKELVGNEYKFKLSLGNPKVKILDDKKIPAKYLTEEIIVDPDKKAILKALKDGSKVEGCILEEVYVLKKSINKEQK